MSYNNGSAESFLDFFTLMIKSKWILHNEVIIMDNASIHTKKGAEVIENCLWETIIDGRPLNAVIVYLPTRSPELNHIELIFHILSRKVMGAKNIACPNAAIKRASEVMENIDINLIARCAKHCNYNVKEI